MKKITLLFSFIICVLFVNAQTLLVEDFNYTIGSDIKSQGWPIHSGSGATKDSILVVDGLTFTGYPGSGIGGAAAVTGKYCDQNKSFTGQTSGTVYAAFMVKVLGAGALATYFAHFGPSTIGSTYFTRIWINATGNGLGIGSSAPSSYTTIDQNTTYLVIMKYDFTSKISSFYLFSTIPSSEPTTENGTFTETTGPAATTPTNLGSFALRQNQSSGAAGQNLVVDGIRVATSWAALFTSTGLNNPTTESIAYVSGKDLVIKNATNGSTVEIFSALGAKVQTAVIENGKIELNNLQRGMYIVRVGKQTQKILL
jgi:hypothetical protein